MVFERAMLNVNTYKPLRTLFAVAACAGVLTFALWPGKDTRRPWEQRVLPIGLVYSDKEKREYAGVPRVFYKGAEQKIFVDKFPFGSLDTVKTRQWSDSGYTGTLEERAPWPGEEDAFLILEKIGKREHSARYSDGEILVEDKIKAD